MNRASPKDLVRLEGYAGPWQLYQQITGAKSKAPTSHIRDTEYQQSMMNAIE